ncbi:hypothetical protein BDW02DRAFT_643646 [Decorospora gaudefroyi]|uniref:Ubiquitination network signaling protein n=1 Tax=Decorospora gaudefroyi TaxID=184978 RepID=A0A6A5KTK6_9PLEO|nr:hypothetical protein BDW02DRAFT_643646 [Decorospora gaudefroyi]
MQLRWKPSTSWESSAAGGGRVLAAVGACEVTEGAMRGLAFGAEPVPAREACCVPPPLHYSLQTAHDPHDPLTTPPEQRLPIFQSGSSCAAVESRRGEVCPLAPAPPSMVAKSKRNAAHDKRHENGLAAPGKRITKQKSNPQLNGHANGKAQQPPPPLSSHGHVDQQDMTQPANTDDGALALASSRVHANTMAAAAPGPGRAEERTRAGSDASLDNTADACRPYDSSSGSGPFDAMPSARRRADTHGATPASLSMASMLAVPATILTSCPLRDVLAILIILLQLPPTVLTVVQFLFATLTFVPPQAGTPLSALSAFPSFTDIFQGSGGTPSLFTTIIADATILLVWLLLWVPAQNFFLDLAQAVIAIALGGAAAGKKGTTNSIFICFIIILSSHLLRFRPLRQHIVHFLWTGLARGGLEFLTSPPSPPTFSESFSAPHGWPRSLLGIHILAQGVVRIIRRSLSRRELANLPTGKKTDPESGVPQRSNSTNLDPNADAPNSSSTDGRPPGPPPVASTHKDKASTSRRKRKQATHVRSQQPFWAALASTKVTVLKEMESSRAANDADEANAKDANHIGNAVWRSEDDRVWISEVGFSDISFRVSLSSGADVQEPDGEDACLGSGIDKSKPFYIRVNGADWSSNRIHRSKPIGFQGQEGTGYWVGEIFGLTALSNYYCEFVRTCDNEVFYSASLITSAGPVKELASASVASPPAHQTLRPSSPTTTLKNSIAAADQQLQEQRNRLKRNKKDHKTAIGNIKKEVDTLSNRLANAGGSDERQRQRVLQFTQNIRQADDAAADFALQAENLGSIPEAEAKEAAAKKSEWKKERDNKNAVAGEFEKIKEGIERQVLSVESDISTAFQKRERLQQRQIRLNEQHDRLVTANAEGFTAKQRREQERTALRQQRADVENQYRSNINGYERRTEESNISTAQMLQTVQHYEDLLQQSHQHMSVPTTPEGTLPGTNMSPHGNGFSNFTFPSLNSHVNSTPVSLRGGRGRSSSMLSNVSGFTDAFDEPQSSSAHVLGNPFSTPGPINGRNRSHGSGSLSSGTSSQSSSQRDPLSPIQCIKPMMVSKLASNSSSTFAALPLAVSSRAGCWVGCAFTSDDANRYTTLLLQLSFQVSGNPTNQTDRNPDTKHHPSARKKERKNQMPPPPQQTFPSLKAQIIPLATALYGTKTSLPPASLFEVIPFTRRPSTSALASRTETGTGTPPPTIIGVALIAYTGPACSPFTSWELLSYVDEERSFVAGARRLLEELRGGVGGLIGVLIESGNWSVKHPRVPDLVAGAYGDGEEEGGEEGKSEVEEEGGEEGESEVEGSEDEEGGEEEGESEGEDEEDEEERVEEADVDDGEAILELCGHGMWIATLASIAEER